MSLPVKSSVTHRFSQDESNLADRIGAPISARLAQLQSSAASDAAVGAGEGGDAAGDNSTPMSAVADRLVDNEEFLDSIIKNLEDVSVLCDLYKISRTKMLIESERC